MRFEVHSDRIVYGMVVFVTMSPREKDSLLMIRLSRTQRNDPITIVDEVARELGGANVKPVYPTEILMGIPIGELCDHIHDY